MLGMIHALASVVLGVAVFIGSLFGAAQSPQLGAALPSATAVFETSLQSRISSTDTSMTLVANSVRGGTTLTGYQCFTLDEGRTDAEYVCGTISGTSVSGLLRGVDPQTATTSNSTLKFAHRVGADVKITDFPVLQILRNQANGTETYANLLNYTYSPNYTNASTTAIASKGYVDSVALVSAPNADDTTKGVVETATASEAASGTSLGGTGARLALGANLATSTCQSAANSVLVASSTSGKLDGRCLDVSNANTWTGAQSFSATTTLTGSNVNANPVKINGLAYAFGPNRAASSTVLSEDGSGNLTFEAPNATLVSSKPGVYQTTTAGASTTLQTVSLPANTLAANSGTLRIEAKFLNVSKSGNCFVDEQLGTGAASTTVAFGTPGSGVGIAIVWVQATSTTSFYSFSSLAAGSAVGIVSASPTNYALGAYEPYSTTAQTYLSFRSNADAGNTCALVGETVELLTK